MVTQRMWHVTLTVAGEPVQVADIRDGLERLSHAHPFLLAGRYAQDRAELRYWEEAPAIDLAVALAHQLWDEHRSSAVLPDWEVVGLEVVDQETFHRRGRNLVERPSLVAAGSVIPF